MTDRDEALARRLLAALDTLENDHEIAQSVRQLRRVLGSDGRTLAEVADSPAVAWNKPQADEVLFADDRQAVSAHLHAMGAMLRKISHPDPVTQAEVQAGRLAMMVGGSATGAAVRTILALLHQMLVAKIQTEPERVPPWLLRPTPSFADVLATTQARMRAGGSAGWPPFKAAAEGDR